MQKTSEKEKRTADSSEQHGECRRPVRRKSQRQPIHGLALSFCPHREKLPAEALSGGSFQ